MKKNKKVKMTFNVTPQVRRQIKNLVEELGYKSESAFCGEAIEEQLSKLQYDSIGTYMNKLLVWAVDYTIAGHIDRIVDMLYKLAISIEKQTMVNSGAYTSYFMEEIEQMAIENVKKRYGKCKILRRLPLSFVACFVSQEVKNMEKEQSHLCIVTKMGFCFL